MCSCVCVDPSVSRVCVSFVCVPVLVVWVKDAVYDYDRRLSKYEISIFVVDTQVMIPSCPDF